MKIFKGVSPVVLKVLNVVLIFSDISEVLKQGSKVWKKSTAKYLVVEFVNA